MAKIKVGQDVIDFIKSQGMAASLKRLGGMSASERSKDAEYAEGIRRMYGDRRFQQATSSTASAKYKTADDAYQASRTSSIPAAPVKKVAPKVAPTGSYVTNGRVAPKPPARKAAPAPKPSTAKVSSVGTWTTNATSAAKTVRKSASGSSLKKSTAGYRSALNK